MNTHKSVFIVTLSILLFSNVSGQILSERKYDPNKAVLHALESTVQSKYGARYEIGYHIMDSLISNSPPNEISDPFGTLKGCVLFSAWHIWQSKDSIVTGIYRNGQIVWDDYPGTKGNFGNELLMASDINDDGEIEILEADYDQELTYREGPGVSFLWILSWNGTRGKIINDVDPLTHQSTVVSTGGLYKIVDINRNEIQVIRGEIDSAWQGYFPNLNPSTLPSITYSWDGNKYGFFPSAHQISANEFYPADLMGISINCTVAKSGNSYIYVYSCTNLATSKQSADHIYIGGLRDTSSIFAPVGWNASNPRYFEGRLFHSSTLGMLGTLGPGHALNGFGTASLALPAIVRYYVQGFRSGSQTATDQEYRTDILTNSVSGYTLGTRDTTVHFIWLDILDALTAYTTQSRSLGWIKDQPTANKYIGYLSSTKSNLQQNNIGAVRSTLGQVLTGVNVDSTSNLTSEAYALIRFNTEYLLSQLPANPAPGFAVRLVNSSGGSLTGGSLQYYEGTWKDAVNNNDGTFNVNTTLSNVSLRMTYAYGSQQKNNVPVNGGPVTFQTVNSQVQLQNSQGSLMDQGTVQYYAGAWRDFGTTINGVATKELLPSNYSFRMTYAFASKDKQQNIGANPTVVFNTVNASVQLKNSLGVLTDQGTVQYYAGAWRSFGTTTNGSASRELLPNSYSFRLTYESVSNDKTQDVGVNSTVSYSTVLCTVKVTNTLGQAVDGAQISYYSGAWRGIGATVSGQITKELLPANLSFRMSYGGKSQDKQQNLSTNSTVEFVAQ